MQVVLATAWLSLCLWASNEPPDLPDDEGPFPTYNHGPYLQSLTSTSVVIVTQSKEELFARLTYSRPGQEETVILEDSPRVDHVFRLDGLEPGAQYEYRVAHLGSTSYPRAVFRTLPGPGHEVHLAAIGDSGTGSDEQLGIRDLLLEFSPDILLHLGDIAYPYGRPSYYHKNFFGVYKDLLVSTCFYPCLGNHDCWFGPKYWKSIFHTPANNPAQDNGYYSFDAGDAHFTCVNSCTGEVPDEQLAWLEDDLAHTERVWKIVYFHHAPYSNATHGGVPRVRDAVVPIFERHKVDLVLSGHEHVYERTYPVLEATIRDGYQDPDYVAPGGVIYVVSGGGGAGLYPFFPSPFYYLNAVFQHEHNFVALRVAPDEIELKAFGLERKLLDGITIRKTGPVAELRFLRSDADQDGEVTLTDAVAILNYLFAGAAPPCLAACDVDGSGDVAITDPISLLDYLFLGGPPPAAPFPQCAGSPGAQEAGCKPACR